MIYIYIYTDALKKKTCYVIWKVHNHPSWLIGSAPSRSGGRDLRSTQSYPLAFGRKVAELHRAWVVGVSDQAVEPQECESWQGPGKPIYIYIYEYTGFPCYSNNVAQCSILAFVVRTCDILIYTYRCNMDTHLHLDIFGPMGENVPTSPATISWPPV